MKSYTWIFITAALLTASWQTVAEISGQMPGLNTNKSEQTKISAPPAGAVAGDRKVHLNNSLTVYGQEAAGRNDDSAKSAPSLKDKAATLIKSVMGK